MQSRLSQTLQSDTLNNWNRHYWAQQDSNLRPTDYESAALTN